MSTEDNTLILAGLEALIANGNAGVANTDLYKGLTEKPEPKKPGRKKKED